MILSAVGDVLPHSLLAGAMEPDEHRDAGELRRDLVLEPLELEALDRQR